MISRILVISAFSAGLAALPMLASAQTSSTTAPTPMPPSTMPQTTTGTGSGTMGTTHQMNRNMGTSSSMGTGSGHMSGNMPDNMARSGNMNMGSSGSFNPHNYRSTTDCLNAASAARVSLSACGNTRGR